MDGNRDRELMRKVLALLSAGLTILAIAWWIREPLAEHLLVRARSARTAWKLADSERLARHAAVMGSTSAAIERAEILLLQGEIARASATLEELSPGGLDSSLAIRRIDLLGRARFLASRGAESVALLEQALAATRAQGDRRAEGQTLVDLSRALYYTQGRSNDARALLHSALAIAREKGDLRLEADAVRHLGVIRVWFDSDAAGATTEYFEPALALYRRIADLHGEAAILSNLALCERIRGRLVESYEHQMASLEISRRIGDRAGVAQSLAALGGLHASTQNYRKTREYLEQSLAITRETGFRLGENDTVAELVGVLMAFGELDAAIGHLEELLARERDNRLLAKYRIAGLGDALLRKGNPRAALARIRESLAMNRAIGQPDHRFTFAVGFLEADALLALGDSTAAEEAIQRATGAGPATAERWDGSLVPALTVANLLVAQGRKGEALARLENAGERDLSLLADAGSRFTEMQNQRHYDRLFELLLGDDHPGERELALVWRFLELLRRRSYHAAAAGANRETGNSSPLDSMIRSLLQGSLDVERTQILYAGIENEILRSADPANARPLPPVRSLDETRRALDEGTAVIAYVLTTRSSWALTMTRQELRSARLPATPREIASKIHLLRTLLEDEAPRERWHPVAAELHRILIAPLAIPQGARELAIVPYAFLREVPFALLPGTWGEPLVERFSIRLVPHGELLFTAPGTAGASSGVAVGVADVGRRGLAPLPAAEEEARDVARIAGGRAITGDQATEASVKRLSGRISFLHVASHAVIDDAMPLLGRLELAGGDGEDGSLTVPEILALDLDADLVTLSACRSSASPPSTGQPLAELHRIGLLDAFLLAGSRSVVASMLPVSDVAAAQLMERFHSFDRSLPRAEALAAAQRAMRRQPGSHPRDWAGFVIYGDGR